MGTTCDVLGSHIAAAQTDVIEGEILVQESVAVVR